MKKAWLIGGCFAFLSPTHVPIYSVQAEVCPTGTEAVLIRRSEIDEFIGTVSEERTQDFAPFAKTVKDLCNPYPNRRSGETEACVQARSDCLEQLGDRIMTLTATKCTAVSQCENLSGKLRGNESQWVCSRGEADEIFEGLKFSPPPNLMDLCKNAGNVRICFPPAWCP